MSRWGTILLGSLFLVWQLGCGSPAPSSTSPPATISIYPSSAVMDSPDLTITIIGSKWFSFTDGGPQFDKAIWVANGTETHLTTTFASASRLIATVPATLLVRPIEAKVRVEIWDRQGDAPIATSSSVSFQVTQSPPSANISISPESAMVGSPDLTLTIAGSNTFTFAQGGVHYSTAVWSQDGINTPLSTTFASSSQLTAIVPAALLASRVTAEIHVEVWDRIEGTRVATSSLVPFQVTSSPPATPVPSISSISPSTVSAGNSDVTITIDGANFGHYGHFIWSTAFWTTNGNLHDTGTWLKTTIISSTQLRAVIPAKLLQSPDSIQIVVMNGDIQGMSDGYFGYPRSNSVTFSVTP